MSGILLIVFAIAIYALAYNTYGRFLSKKFSIDNSRSTPSHTQNDGVDYVPAKPSILLGHHFASIAGAGPIIGPVIAVGFGWLPVYIWVLAGAVFFGGVHDYTSIIASIRHKGKSIGQIIENYIGLSGKKMFLFFVWATLILVIAVFAIIIADTFTAIPSAGTSTILFILLAVLFGLAIYKFKFPLWLSSLVGVTLLFASVYIGQLFPLQLNELTWLLILFVYVFIASVTPVWILLQPRDYLNSYFLYALMLGGIAGLFFALPELNIPAFSTFQLDKIGFLFPALFVTVACGAISGFHSIVGSGTTSKQLDKESDAKIIGYGGMLIEGVLAVLALIAAASLTHTEFLNTLKDHGPVAVFSAGVANFINAIPVLGISVAAAQSFVALAVSAFALTTLDTATRLGRYSFQEFFETGSKSKQNILVSNRFVSTAITVMFGLALTFSGQTMSLWPVFGSANQLLAALALLAVTVWVSNLKLNYLFTLIPMLFMFGVTLSALGMLFYNNLIYQNNFILSFISLGLFALSILLGIKAYNVLTNNKLEHSLQQN